MGSVLAEDVAARDDLPPFRASVMDGYAVSTSHTASSFEVVASKSFAGQAAKALDAASYQSHECLYVTTGAPVPEFFDCVVPIEKTEPNQNRITVKGPIKAGQWIRSRGSDIAAGAVVLERGQHLNPAEIGLLSTVGHVKNIKVFKKPTIGLLSSGNELVECHEDGELADGKIRDSNKPMMKGLLI